MVNESLDELSSSQYAFRSDICIYRDFYDDDDLRKAIKVFYPIRGVEQEVALKFSEGVHTINCFPYNYNSIPKKSTVLMRLEQISLNLGFLNKHYDTQQLTTYIEIIIKNKYHRYNYSFDLKQFEDIINEGKDKELEEMNTDIRKYIWNKKHMNLNKSIKSRIMIRDRFKNDIMSNTSKVFDAVNNLLETDEFIHNKIISEMTKMPMTTLEKYVMVHKDEINNHNKSKYGTDNYNKYINAVTIKDIKDAVTMIEFANKKINISSVAKKSRLHRNTVSRLNKLYNLF